MRAVNEILKILATEVKNWTVRNFRQYEFDFTHVDSYNKNRCCISFLYGKLQEGELMHRNILLTSLCANETDIPLRYFSIGKEFGADYCDSYLDAEAGIKAMLSRYRIDEIIVIGDEGCCSKEDDLSPAALTKGRSLYSRSMDSLSAYGLLQRRIAEFSDEINPEKEENKLLPEEAKENLIRLIKDFKTQDNFLQNIKENRLFDALSQHDEVSEKFWNAVLTAGRKAGIESSSCRRWVKNYLYNTLKPSAKLELLPVNEHASIRLIPETEMVNGDKWTGSAVTKDILKENDDVNLYITLNSEDAAETFVVLNMLDIMISMPGSSVSLKKLFTVRNRQMSMTGILRDDTDGFAVTELFHAVHAFLNYGKADLMVDVWKKSSAKNESIAAMVYAMRHVDVGLSMCNIPEMEAGILRLRELFRSEKFWKESGNYGIPFSVIAESIRNDYGPLLNGDGKIPFLELVIWAYRHQFYQQTLTLIESRAPIEMVKTGMFYYCGSEDEKDRVMRLFARNRLELKPYEYYKMDDIDHYFVKSYDRAGTKGRVSRNEDTQRVYAALRTESVNNTDPSRITGITACSDHKILRNVLFAYYHIGEVRNKISHADAAAMAEKRLMISESDDSSALSWMKDAVDYFIAAYAEAEEDVKGKDPHVVYITGDEVRIVAESIRRSPRA